MIKIRLIKMALNNIQWAEKKESQEYGKGFREMHGFFNNLNDSPN